MSDISRRRFLDLSVKLAIGMGLGSSAVPKIVEALEQLESRNAPVLWLQGLSCSGCSISFLNSDAPGAAQILTQQISLLFHSTLSTATGATAMEVVHRSIDHGGYYLIVEGSIPLRLPLACRMGDEPILELASRAARNAKAVVAVGTCASFGGIPAAENNPTGAVGISQLLQDQKVPTPVINLPGCPAHPDWILGTLAHILQFGLPPLDDKRRPKMFYSRILHDQCPRFADYERERFAKTFADDGCFFKLGCSGPNTYADCSLRQWNDGTNSCIKAGSPCIGCAGEDFASAGSFPFFTKKSSSEMKKG